MRTRATRSAAVTATLIPLCFATATAAPGDDVAADDAAETAAATPSIEVGAPRTIFENLSPAPQPQFASFPGIIDAGEVDDSGRRRHDYHVSYNAGSDVIGDIVLGHLRSDDGTAYVEYEADPELDVHNAIRLTDPDRTLIAPGYEPIFDNETPPYEDVDNDRQFPLFRHDGDGWVRSPEPATVITDEPVAVARLHQGIAMLPDGDLIAPLYGTTADGESYVYVVRSEDGLDWRQVGTVATGPEGRWTESHLVRLPDGTVAAAVRYGNHTTGGLDLYLARSATPDGSGTWHEPVPIAVNAGAAPRFQQLAGGALALLSGRFDNQLRVSFDGLGDTWTEAETLYANYPVDAPDEGRERELGSSGYLGVVATGAGELLVLGDNCAGHWGCPDTVDEFTVDDRKTLWASDVRLDPGLGERLDLLGGYRDGSITFVDTEPVRYAKGQRSLLPYAFDADTSASSSLVTADRRATVDLGRTYPLTAVVTHADLTGPKPLLIETSVDGRRWTPLAADGDGAVKRTERPQPARHLRLSDPNPTTTATADWSFVNELQVYTKESR